MIEIKIAIRNLLANSRRTMLTLFIIIIGLSAILFISGYINMVREGLAETLIREQFAHFRIYKKGFQELDDPSSMAKSFSPDEVTQIESILMDMENVEYLIPRITIQGMVGNAVSRLFMGYGSDPYYENTMSYGILLDGVKLSTDDPYMAVFGTGLAEKLDLKLNDETQIIVPNEGGGIEAELITVGGIADFGPKALNDTTLLISLEVAKYLNYTDNTQMLLVLLEDTSSLDEIYTAFFERAEKEGLEVEGQTWIELDPFYVQVMRDYTFQLNMVATIFLCVVILAVSNTIYMSIIERTPEIGTLRAIGISRVEIIRTIFIEGLILGIVGSLAGVLIAYGLQWFFEVTNFMLPPPPTLFNPIPLVIRLRFQDILFYSGLLGGSSALVSILPGLKASNTNIVSAIRHA